MNPTRTCPRCGREFPVSTRYKKQRFCSLDCARRVSRAVKQELTCAYCGATFSATAKSVIARRTYCSHTCMKKALFTSFRPTSPAPPETWYCRCGGALPLYPHITEAFKEAWLKAHTTMKCAIITDVMEGEKAIRMGREAWLSLRPQDYGAVPRSALASMKEIEDD
jgi:hypothetical protein